MNSKPARILRHTARKIVIMPAQWRIRPTVAAGALLIVTSFCSIAGTAPEGTPAVFLLAVQEFQTAEMQEKSGQTAGAVSHYQTAAKLLEKLAKSNPDWQHDIVEYRLRKSREGIDRLGKPREVTTPVANSAAGNATAAPVTSNVGRTLPLKGEPMFKGKAGDFFLKPGELVTVVKEDVENQRVTITCPDALEEKEYDNWIVGLEDTSRMIRVCNYINAKFVDGKIIQGGIFVPRMHRLPTGDEPEVASTSVKDEEKMFELVNQYRHSKGLKPLTKQASLTRSARIHCARMLQYGYLASNGMATTYIGGPQMSAAQRIQLYAPNGSGSAAKTGIKMTPETVLEALLAPNTQQCGKTLSTPKASSGNEEINRPDNIYIGIGKVGDTWCLDFGT